MSTEAAPTVAAPSADSSVSADPFEAIFDGVLDANVPEQNFNLPKGRQLGESVDAVETPAPAPAVAAPAKATEPAAILAPAVDDTDDVGTPYAIGKDGRMRGADGRYAKKETPPVDTPSATADTKETKDGAPTQAAPFRYRAMGETHEPKGFVMDPVTGKVTIDPEATPLLREALNALKVRDVQHIPTIQKTLARNAELEAQLADRTQQSSLAENQAKALMASLEDALTTADETAAVEKFFKMRDDLPSLKRQAEIDYWKAQAQRTPSAAPAAATAPVVEAPKEASGLPSQDEAVASAQEFLEHAKIDREYGDMTDADWQQFDARVKRTPMAYVRRATAKDVKEYGATMGEPVFDTDLITEDVAQFAKGLREQRAAALKREQLAAANARTTQPSVTTPPAVTASRPPTKAPTTTGLKNKKELEDWLNSDEL